MIITDIQAGVLHAVGEGLGRLLDAAGTSEACGYQSGGRSRARLELADGALTVPEGPCLERVSIASVSTPGGRRRVTNGRVGRGALSWRIAEITKATSTRTSIAIGSS
jgi:hypothetical protein